MVAADKSKSNKDRESLASAQPWSRIAAARKRAAASGRPVSHRGGVKLLELARNAKGCSQSKCHVKNAGLLNFLPSNSTWDDGRVVARLRQAFDPLAETAAATALACERTDRKNGRD
jgi:hypothetical protein